MNLDTRPSLSLGNQRSLLLDRARIMGIINVTPDSFSDGGQFFAVEQAVAHGLRLAAEGADILDVGGESTRPGATPIATSTELARIIPVIEALARVCPLPISVDTSKPEVMIAAVAAGAVLINDVRALREPGALAAAADTDAAICLMHMQGAPAHMQLAPHYGQVVEDVKKFLTERMMACRIAGIAQQRLLIDPGFGFGKTIEHNLALLAGLGQLCALNVPVLVGLSRKRMLAELTGRELDQRVFASIAAAVLAVERGAQIVRVHDVAATRDALLLAHAVKEMQPKVQSVPRKTDAISQARALFGEN